MCGGVWVFGLRVGVCVGGGYGSSEPCPLPPQVHGPELHSFGDKARAVSEATGKEIKLNVVPPEAWTEALVAQGLSQDFAKR